MKYTSKLILNGEEYQFAAPGGGEGPFTYDFLGKTQTDFENDGWTVVRGGSVDSYGIYGGYSLSYDLGNLSDTNVITITATTYTTQKSAWSSGTVNTNIRDGGTSHYGGAMSTLTSNRSGVLVNYGSSRTSRTGVDIATGAGELVATIDLINKEITSVYSAGGTIITSASYTISDSIIAEIKACQLLVVGADDVGGHLQSVSIDIQ